MAFKIVDLNLFVLHPLEVQRENIVTQDGGGLEFVVENWEKT